MTPSQEQYNQLLALLVKENQAKVMVNFVGNSKTK